MTTSSSRTHAFTEGLWESGPFTFESGDTLDRLRIGYSVHGQMNAARDNVVLLMPGSSHDRRGMHGHIGPDRAFDTERYCVVSTDALGLGLASKPSDGLQGRFPRYGIRDLVRAQRDLVRVGLGLGDVPLAAVGGTSMGAFQSLEWIVNDPDSARAAVLMVPADRSGQVIRSAMQRMLDILALDPNWDEGRCMQPTTEGLKLVGRHYHAWAVTDAYIESRGAAFEDEARATGDRYATMGAWDVIRRYQCSSAHDVAAPFGGDLKAALARVTARVLLLPCVQDRLLGIEHARVLAAGLPHVQNAEIDSPLGHMAWRPQPGSAETDFLIRTVRTFLG
jgi:homoserine O-acetyltransferase